jgi:hypothetical protein
MSRRTGDTGSAKSADGEDAPDGWPHRGPSPPSPRERVQHRAMMRSRVDSCGSCVHHTKHGPRARAVRSADDGAQPGARRFIAVEALIAISRLATPSSPVTAGFSPERTASMKRVSSTRNGSE